jgi:hypothetical protein
MVSFFILSLGHSFLPFSLFPSTSFPCGSFLDPAPYLLPPSWTPLFWRRKEGLYEGRKDCIKEGLHEGRKNCIEGCMKEGRK